MKQSSIFGVLLLACSSGGSGGGTVDGGTGGTGAVGGTSGNGGGGTSAGAGGSTAGAAGATPSPGSCVGHCGSAAPVAMSDGSSCYCNPDCVAGANCCTDFAAACGPAGAGLVNCLEAGICTADQLCCIMELPTGTTYECRPDGEYCSTVIDCDGPDDCPSDQVCCAHWISTGYVDFRCQSACDDWPDLVVCGTDPDSCGPYTCEPLVTLSQINVCGSAQ